MNAVRSERVQERYVEYLSSLHADLGGKRNLHNGKGCTYDCIALMSYYSVCESAAALSEIGEMEENLILPSFRKLEFVDCNKPFWRRLMYMAFRSAERASRRWQDYKMNLSPYDENKPIRYELTACPVAEFAKKHGLEDVIPALCNVDYKAMELIGAKLIRTGTYVDGARCDYTICGSWNEYALLHPEYRDEAGFIRNR